MLHQGQQVASKAAHGLAHARPALVSARSSRSSLFNSNSPSAAPGATRSASSYVPEAPAVFDIFDAPPRMIYDDADNSAVSAMSYKPSHFRPRPTPTPSPPHSHTHSNGHSSSFSHPPPQARGLSTRAAPLMHTHPSLPPTHLHMFDGPARPRHRPFVSSKNQRAASTATPPPAPFGGADAYEPLAPEIFDGPARPRRRAPPTMKKAEQGGSRSSAWVAAAGGLVGLGAIQSYESNESGDESEAKKSAPNNIFIFTPSLERMEASISKPDTFRDEVLPNIF